MPSHPAATTQVSAGVPAGGSRPVPTDPSKADPGAAQAGCPESARVVRPMEAVGRAHGADDGAGDGPVLLVAPDGAVSALYDESLDLSVLGPLAITRASHVEPTPEGLWAADLSPVGGPTLGPFPKRSEALSAEVAWLRGNVLS